MNSTPSKSVSTISESIPTISESIFTFRKDATPSGGASFPNFFYLELRVREGGLPPSGAERRSGPGAALPVIVAEI